MRLGKNPTSVSREVSRNCKFDGRKYGCSKNSTLCSTFKECEVRELCAKCTGKKCSTCSKTDCTQACAAFDKMECRRTTHFPYVCNGCPKRNRCRLERHSHSANVAQVKADDGASAPRQGVDLTGRELTDPDALVAPLMMRGQSLNQIHLAHEDDTPAP